MKHLLFAVLMMALSSCHHATPDEMAGALSIETSKKSLYSPESSIVIENHVDSAFMP